LIKWKATQDNEKHLLWAADTVEFSFGKNTILKTIETFIDRDPDWTYIRQDWDVVDTKVYVYTDVRNKSLASSEGSPNPPV